MASSPSTPSSILESQSTEMSPSPLRRTARKQHAALKGNPSTRLSFQQLSNINDRIRETAESVVKRRFKLDGLGPSVWELHANLGVAIQFEVQVRPLKREFVFDDPNLRRRILEVARDTSHPRFAHNFDGGRIWISFQMLDLQEAMLPLPTREEKPGEVIQSSKTEEAPKNEDATSVEDAGLGNETPQDT